MKLSVDWYKEKTQQIQAAMAGEHLDGLFLLDTYNVFYATGFFFYPTERPLGLFIPASGDPKFYVPLLDEDMARKSWVSQVYSYFNYPGTTHPLIWMINENAGTKRIGVDKLSYRQWQMIRSVRPDIMVTDLVYNMRLIKDDQEIALIEKAGIYADHLVAMTREAAIMGLSEIDAFDYARKRMVERMQRELGNLVIVNLGVANGAVLYGPNSANPHGLMADRKPQPGDVVEASFGALISSYEAESEHTFIFGTPTPRQASYFNAMYDAWQAGMEAAKPGVRCSQVNEAALSVIRAAGYEEFLRHRTGHGKGLEEHEPPWIAQGDDTILQPGMIISNEPGLYVPGFGGFRHSDTLVITETGNRRLTHYPRDLESSIIPIP